MMNRKSQRNPAFPDLRLSRYGSLRIIGLATVVLMAIAIRAFVPGAVSAQDSFPNPFGTPLSPGDSSGQDADLELTATLKKLTSRTAELQLTVTLPAGFYIYSTDPSFGGGTTIKLTDTGSLKPVDNSWRSDREPKVVNDADLGQTVEKFFDSVTWSQTLQTAESELPAELSVTGELSGQYCSTGDAGVCKPIIPARKFTATFVHAESAPAPASAPASSSAKPPERADRSPVKLHPMVGYGANRKPAPIQFTITLTPAEPKIGDEVTLSLRANVDRPWHTFALDQDPEMAGQPTEITLTEVSGLKPIDVSFRQSMEPETHTIDPFVQRIHFDTVTWTRRFTADSTTPRLAGSVLYQMCNDGTCLPPSEVEFAVTPGDADIAAEAPPIPGDRSSDHNNSTQPNSGTGAKTSPDPAEQSRDELLSSDAVAKDGLLAFVITAIGAGFVALLTPCVFPMIPVTVAFFLKQSEKKSGNSIGLAVVYCLGIIGTFTILGLLVAVVFGPTKMNEFANNRWLNLFFAALFTVFSLMLMGMFEVRLPSWLLTWSSKRESTGGITGALFMALTFTLVSFTCTFAFVGSLLVLAAKGAVFWPVVGMLAFSSAFASPFFFLAVFPSLLKKLPKSGGWMNTVKVTMGLVELALVLKFLSVADIGFSPNGLPYLLDPTSFLVGWVAIAGVTGLYLLNVFRMSHDMPADGISAVRCCFALLFLCLAGYIGVGTFGANAPTGVLWHQIAAFAPPSKPHHLLDFRVAVKKATDERKLLFVDFTGVNCVNCRKMENTVLIEPDVVRALSGMVQVQLYTDKVPGIDDPALQEELLALNRNLQGEWFRDVTLPGYAVVTSDGKTVLKMFKGLDSSGGRNFVAFLKQGIANSLRPRTEGNVAEHSPAIRQ